MPWVSQQQQRQAQDGKSGASKIGGTQGGEAANLLNQEEGKANKYAVIEQT